MKSIIATGTLGLSSSLTAVGLTFSDVEGAIRVGGEIGALIITILTIISMINKWGGK